MAAYTIYDVLRHLTTVSPWPTEEDRRAAMASITEAENLSVLGNVARNIECPHTNLQQGKCEECGRTVEVGHKSLPYGAPTYQGWR